MTQIDLDVPLPVFNRSEPLTLGVELELQLIDYCDFDLSSSAASLLESLSKQSIPATISPELTESMIEVSVGVFHSWMALDRRLASVADSIIKGANWLNIGICGGGAHPFQRWQQRRIFDNKRFKKVSSLYGYLAKQFTVFGQHIHVGCSDGDSALRLLHALNRFVPHFIALSASSPFFQGANTSFHSSRLNSVSAFPLSGRAPFFLKWDQFESDYFHPMVKTGIVRSMKDFYWDIRPKPEYGTIELRVCDTPLDIFRASLLAGYLQAICARLMEEDGQICEREYLVYSYNRFQASRFGLDATYLEPRTLKEQTIRQNILSTIEWLSETNSPTNESQSLYRALTEAAKSPTDAEVLVQEFSRAGTLEDVVQFAMNRFCSPKSLNPFDTTTSTV